jgi:hypothetical protein
MGRPRKHKINEDYFDIIDTPEKAYVVGFLFADGGNLGSGVYMTLQTQDRGILEQIRSCLQSETPLRELQNGKYCRLDIIGVQMAKRLGELGIEPRKTFKIRFPSWLSPELHSHFIRGYFDGDGCLTVSSTRNKAAFSIVSNGPFCEDLQSLFKNIGINSQVMGLKCGYDGQPTEAKRLMVCGNKQVLKLMDWLYTNSTIHLERKHQKYLALKANPISRKPFKQPQVL